VKTGLCGLQGNCEVTSWCPLEDKISGRNVYLEGVEDWSVLFRLDAYFSKFNFRKTNTDVNGTVKGYNAFNVSDIVAQTGYSYSQVQERGCLIVADVDFQCNLDSRSQPACTPTFKFTRLDDPDPNSFTSGFNFRYYRMSGLGGLTDFGDTPSVRFLYKMYGVRIVFQVTGEARKFSLIALTTTLGAGLALLSLSSLIADYFMVYLHPKKELYSDHKYESVRGHLSEDHENLVDERQPLRSKS
jgi:hypothetical protein